MVNRLMVATAALATSASANGLLERQGSGATCDCWQTNGTSADSYTHYRFFDYRNIKNVPQVPALIPADADAQGTNYPSQGGFVNSTDDFGKFWTTETFTYLKDADKSNKYEAQASMANVYIQSKDSYSGDYMDDAPDDAISWLTLRTSRPDKNFATMSQLTSKDVYVYGTMRFAGRVVGPTGACAGFFSYALDDGDNNEADIEILTKDGAYANGLEVHYTNQPSDINGEDSGTSLNSTLVTSFYKWQTHRFDWRQSATDFYADAGQHKLQIAKQVPKGDSQLTINMWSTGNDWTDSLAVGEEAEYHILWIEWAYNTSDTAQATCSNTCQLDSPEVGFLSPSKFADDEVAKYNGTNQPVAIPSTVDEGQSNGSSTSSTSTSTNSASSSTQTGASSKVVVNSLLFVGAGMLAAVLAM
ncbi:glycoside hydrolase family 16 protein [Acrodontium crateriforme]|uniref:Glycoside hydrolase family 16 protein n=1 Tax=Acrodontium crateriforme TaxID=150365 RepID=A0AAQ3M4P4_9PEZI|nr:glycoside hydrolase family 16 protein [Acrodontium crateriforme]